MFLASSQTEATFAVTSRFSFPQLLLLTCYVALQSSLPARLRDNRELRDLYSRNEDEWYPRIGEEGFSDMKTKIWTATSLETRKDWEWVRDYLLQENLIYGVSVSPQDLREYLCGLLRQIEQVSSESVIALLTPRTAPTPPLSNLKERASLVLVCLSLGVTLTPGDPTPLGSLLTHPNDYQRIGTMIAQLQQSPLFIDDIQPQQLWASLSSLHMILGYHEEVVGCRSAFDRSSYDYIWTVETQEHEIQTSKYTSFKTKRASSSVQHYQKRQKRNTQSPVDPAARSRKQLSGAQASP
ncbi:uncharacterized protein N7496_000852 [Penicillium cataractarum]|uniref:Uncharacterized protein n=1 Tax=Penicillium cataractarum TaxID=2100454 RepID=A0A9W9VV81_9EURO|nr:uncharacterized protein N7496_000852 [Penicillium cataractarum]KAJ5389784.1 hypothetical protein N7496_000852 [Penicillium cataractarum]